jgi:hypothetical protein
MTKREEGMCYDLASFLCHPDSIGLGDTAYTLVGIIRNITSNNKTVRNKVFEFCEDMVDDGDFDSDAYETTDPEEAMSKIKEDYNVRFFKK